ncbi:hypothetical protein K8354_16225 [Polaribacter litorisediminis]|uniref:hypothetical protein n=1 Tax=Polaribacter litorisediminis TaxID=1908341 RepID=UPI001CBB2010|nr:hypothetical protein [Polaribacter litorisediminis]UAM97817.1 hypothetical protein K8354_16225 [Polaribacter litorisediminis]
MEYVITVRNKRKPEKHFNVVLEHKTKVENKIKWKEQEYLVKEIIIVNPDENIIELKCINITKPKKKLKLTTTWS